MSKRSWAPRSHFGNQTTRKNPPTGGISHKSGTQSWGDNGADESALQPNTSNRLVRYNRALQSVYSLYNPLGFFPVAASMKITDWPYSVNPKDELLWE